MARRPFGCGERQGDFLAGKLTDLLDHSSPSPVLAGVGPAPETPHYSISMRSRLAGPAEPDCPPGLASSPKPFSASNPAFLKCFAARTRRSPGTSTYATTPNSEPLRLPSSDIPQPHSQRLSLEARPRR